MARVKKLSTSRLTYTLGMVLSLVYGVLRGYVLCKGLTKKNKETIERQFGTLTSVHNNTTGSMRCQTHVDWFLGEVVPLAVTRARRLMKAGLDQPALLIEDSAPGHTGDTDNYLLKMGAADADAKGWKAKRKEKLKENKVRRALLGTGTPGSPGSAPQGGSGGRRSWDRNPWFP